MKWRELAAHMAARDDEFLDTECSVLVDEDGIHKEATVTELADGGLKVKVVTREWVIRWKDGAIETVKGSSFAAAFSEAGYGAGAAAAIDEYELFRE